MNDISKKNSIIFITSILAISFFLHIAYMTMDVQGAHSWRQSQTMWNINNFARYDANILNPRVSHFNGAGPENLYRYEFPLMQWIIGMTMRVLGESTLIMRLYMFLFSALGMIGFYRLSSLFVKKRISRIMTTFFFTFGPVFYYYSICPLPDVLALSASFWYLFFILTFFENKKQKYLWLASLSLLIATFVKLPYLMFTIVSIVYFFKSIIKNRRITADNIKQAIIQLFVLLPAFFWYKWVIPTWEGNSIVKGILELDLSASEIFHMVKFNLGELTPTVLIYPSVWIFFIWGIMRLIKNKSSRKWIGPIFLITMLYYTFELNAIKTQHDYYLMPFLVWLYLIVAIGIESFINQPLKWKNIALIITIISAPISAFLVSEKKYSIEGYYTLHDAVIHRDKLRKAAPQNDMCMILSDLSNYIFSYQIDKRGHVFQSETIPLGWVSDMIRNKEVKYSYSNSRKFDENPLFLNHYVSEKVMQGGNINVFKLKSKAEITQMENMLKHMVFKQFTF